MKIKSFQKKLSLNKKTISNLDNNDMSAVKGGCVLGTTSCRTLHYSCYTFEPTCLPPKTI